MALRCFTCKGFGYRLGKHGEKVACPECGGEGVDPDVIRERAEERRKEQDDHEAVKDWNRRSGTEVPM